MQSYCIFLFSITVLRAAARQFQNRSAARADLRGGMKQETTTYTYVANGGSCSALGLVPLSTLAECLAAVSELFPPSCTSSDVGDRCCGSGTWGGTSRPAGCYGNTDGTDQASLIHSGVGGNACFWFNHRLTDEGTLVTGNEVPQYGYMCKTASTPASAVGDPHLQNIHGERFDLMKPGTHVLINIPRGVTADKTLLRVQADAHQLGPQCSDMYFQEVNITGAWAEKTQVGGLRFDVSDRARDQNSGWVILGPVGLKVAFGHTDQGTKYMNIFAKHLGQAGFAVGGLLGEDDHQEVSTPQGSCAHRVSLNRQAAPKRGGSWAVA